MGGCVGQPKKREGAQATEKVMQTKPSASTEE